MQKIIETGSENEKFHRALSSKHAKNKLTALHSAAANKNLELLQILMSQGTQLNTAPKEISMTPLGCAALRGHTNCVRYLLHFCSTKADESSLDPLHAAVVTGHKDVVGILLDNGADVNAKAYPNNSFFKDLAFWQKQKQYQGKTPLHLAVQVGTLEVVKMLIRSGARVNEHDDNLMSALHHAALLKQNDCLEYLLQVEEIEIEQGMIRLRTALHLACLVGNMDGMKMLIAKGANVEAEDMHLRTPLHYAAFAKEYECVSLLLQLKADSLKHTSIYGETALHFASENRDANVMQLLINSGVDIHAENLNMQNALQEFSDSVCKQLRPDLMGTSLFRNWFKFPVIIMSALLISFFIVRRSCDLLPDNQYIRSLYILLFTVHFSFALELFSKIPMRYKSCKKFLSWPMSLETFIFLVPFLALLIWYLPNLTYTVICSLVYEQLYLDYILICGFLILGVFKFMFYMIDSFYSSSDLARMIK
jgi:ankyrin repeat protein